MDILDELFKTTLVDYFKPFYLDVGNKDFLDKKEYSIPKDLESLFNLFLTKNNSNIKLNLIDTELPNFKDYTYNNNILIGFSGGKHCIKNYSKNEKELEQGLIIVENDNEYSLRHN